MYISLLLQGDNNFCKSERRPPDHVISPWNDDSSFMGSPSLSKKDSDEVHIPYYSDRYVCSGSATAPAILLLALSLLTTLTAAADGRCLLVSLIAHSSSVNAGMQASTKVATTKASLAFVKSLTYFSRSCRR